MVDFEECNKKLGILEGYRHPVLGTNFLYVGNVLIKYTKIWKNGIIFFFQIHSTLKLQRSAFKKSGIKTASMLYPKSMFLKK